MRLITLLLFIFLFLSSSAQDSSRVEAFLGDEFAIYPYNLNIYPGINIYTGQHEDEWVNHFEYIQDEEGIVIRNGQFTCKDTSSNKFERKYRDILRGMFEYQDAIINFDSNIPPALDSLPDGKYIRYYNKVSYVDGDTLKFIQHKIASIHYLKNNVPNGTAYWFSIDKQEVYKKGNYTDGKREGLWFLEKKEDIAQNIYKKNHRDDYIDYQETKKRIQKAPKIKKTIHYFEICETRCNYVNGMKNGLQTQKNYTIGLNDYFSIDSTHYLNNKKSGKYSLYHNDKVGISGYYSIDSNNNEYQSGEWFFYDWKTTTETKKNGEPKYERFLSHHFIVNDEQLIGKGTIIRSSFEPIKEYGNFMGSPINGYILSNFCGEIIQPENHNNSFSEFYSLNNPDNIDFNYGDEALYDYYFDSLGYILKYLEYEHYYPNGQLFIKFKSHEGNLGRENDTVFWENGRPMNCINYFPNRDKYEQKIFDSSSVLKEFTVYDTKGNYLQNLLPSDSYYKIIDGINFSKAGGNLFAFGGSISRDWYTTTRDLNDSNQLISALYDNLNKRYLKKLYINPQTWEGKLYKELEPNFGFLNATIQFDSLFDYSNYEEVITIGELKLVYETRDTIDWGWIEKHIKPQYNDTIFSPSIYSYADFSDHKKESVIQYNNIPYTGKLVIHLDSKTQTITKTNKAIHIYLLENVDHTTLLKHLFPSFQHYPRLVDKQIFNNTTDYKQKVLDFYRIATLEFHLVDGKLEGDGSVKNYTKNTLAKISYYDNKKNGALILYSEYPFTYLMSYYRNNTVDGKQKPSLYISLKTTYKNNLLEGEFNEYNSFSLETYSGMYHLGLQHGQELEYSGYWDNKLISTSNYQNGALNGEQFSYDRYGQLLRVSNYLSGERHGLEIEYDTNNRVISELNYADDLLNGTSKFYHKNGEISQIGIYINGYLKDSIFFYNDNGSLKTILIYKGPCFVSGNTYLNGTLKSTYTNSIDKFKSGKYTSSDSSDVIFDYRTILNKTNFTSDLDHFTIYDKTVHDSVYYMEFDETGKILKEGEEFNNKKIGLWKYNLPYVGKYIINYFDTVLIINDLNSIKSIGFLTQQDENGTILSKKYIIDENSLYNCGQNETYEINTYYVIYEKDSSLHLINGQIKNYYPNGVKQSEGMNKNGLPQGVWKYYNDNGSLREIGRHVNGKKEGRWLSGDLSQIAYLGDICLDMDKTENQKMMQSLENSLEIQETFFEKGKKISSNYFQLEK